MDGFPAIRSLDDLIAHNDALERYVWLSAHMLARWRRDHRIRAFGAKGGDMVYPMQDLVDAANRELTQWADDNRKPEDCSNTGNNGSIGSPADPAITDSGTISESDALREDRSMAVLFPQQNRN